MSYNGWRNYETWNVALWMDNDEGSYSYWREEAESIAACADSRESFVDRLARSIETSHTENAPALSGTYADLLGGALSSVDWREIAEHYTDLWDEAHPKEEEETE